MPKRDRGIQQTWMPYSRAAQEYLGVSPDLLRQAINSGELAAYEKPLTRGRTGTTRENHSYFVNLEDVDAYIRAHWKMPERI
ncbi:MAG: hypothetical protein IJF97_01590 [Eggerthellaceae bacterium]|nr:hypothetical protein [Eggerthellaceae bacterium]